ncbi:MAG TPA: NADH-quinone oxidoreductase subunit L, partial [Flavobacterium sp.]|nr:NADH-quinone oxidoreductase subunit L [Flavobacterium sp.]
MDTTLFTIALLLPLAGFLIATFFGKALGKKAIGFLSSATVGIAFIITAVQFVALQNGASPEKHVWFSWIEILNYTIDFGFYYDQLSVLWLLFVTGIGTLIHIYSISYMHDDENFSKFFSYLNLFVFFMMVLVTGSNLLIMFIGWEGVGLCSYLLIGFWYQNQEYNDAAKKAFIMNRIGDLGFLVGTFVLLHIFGTIDFIEIKNFLEYENLGTSVALLSIATLGLFIGATGKSAQLPLFTWLPDAMAGPTPVSALIHAATMVTAGIFLITRMNFIFDLTPNIQFLIAVVGGLTALVAASIALVQNDIKKVLAFSTVSQLGLMFMALGFGAYEIAVFHVITHAFFKACLFLG